MADNAVPSADGRHFHFYYFSHVEPNDSCLNSAPSLHMY